MPKVSKGLDRHPNKRAHAGNGGEKCGAVTRQPGNERYPGEQGRPCRQPAGFGTPNSSGRCYLHGGLSPSGLVHGARGDAERAAARELQKLNLWGARRDVSPVEALSEELERTAGRVTAIEQRLAQLPEASLDSPRGRGLAAELTAERGQLQRVAEAANRAGVTERRSEVAHEQALQIASLMRSTLEDLELTPAQQAAVPALMRFHFAALGCGTPAGPRPPRPSQLPPGAFFDVDAARRRHEESQSGERQPPPEPPERPHHVTPEPDRARLIELRSVLDRPRTSHIDGRN